MHGQIGVELTCKNAIHSAPQVERLAASNLFRRLECRRIVRVTRVVNKLCFPVFAQDTNFVFVHLSVAVDHEHWPLFKVPPWNATDVGLNESVWSREFHTELRLGHEADICRLWFATTVSALARVTLSKRP